jgi:type IV fimbrial biogenesis protein FimT
LLHRQREVLVQVNTMSITHRPAAARGFTLIELMVTLVLLAVMLTLAAPSFLTFQRNAELTSTANSFVGSLSAARAEAMKRQMRAFVIPGDGVTQTTDWSKGWVVYVDTNTSTTAGSVLPDSADIIVAKQGPMPSAVTVAASTFLDGTSAYVMFNGSGFMALVGSVFSTDRSITLSNGTSEANRLVIASPSGRLRVCKSGETGCSASSF